MLVDELSTGRGVGPGAMRSASEAMDKHDRQLPGSVKAPARSNVSDDAETFHVFGSGNLGLIYVRGEKEQLTRSQLDARFPALVDGLAAHPGVGFAVVRDEEQGPMAIGAQGSHRLEDGHVEGVDPLLPFGPDAPGFVLRVALRPEAPDIYVNSRLDEGTNEVAAFEGLVGCHGGLGGWQDNAFVMVPTGIPFPRNASSAPTSSRPPRRGSCATSVTASRSPTRRRVPERAERRSQVRGPCGLGAG